MSGGVTLRDEHVFDGVQYPLLPVARQQADLLEDASGFAHRAAARAFARCVENKFIGSDAEDGRQLAELFGGQCHVAPFPQRIRCLGDVELCGDVFLRQARRFAEGFDARAKIGAC